MAVCENLLKGIFTHPDIFIFGVLFILGVDIILRSFSFWGLTSFLVIFLFRQRAASIRGTVALL